MLVNWYQRPRRKEFCSFFKYVFTLLINLRLLRLADVLSDIMALWGGLFGSMWEKSRIAHCLINPLLAETHVSLADEGRVEIPSILCGRSPNTPNKPVWYELTLRCRNANANARQVVRVNMNECPHIRTIPDFLIQYRSTTKFLAPLVPIPCRIIHFAEPTQVT